MKLVLFLPLLFISIAEASSDQLLLRGVVKEQISIEINQGQVEIKTNAENKNIPVRINRKPAAVAGLEQIEVIVP